MNTSTLETTDIFRGAFFLCMGGHLTDVKFRINGKQTATFIFAGPGLHKHDKDYRNGHAQVNPLQFKEALNHLRDILFKRLNENRTPEMRRYDRSKRNRYHQKHY